MRGAEQRERAERLTGPGAERSGGRSVSNILVSSSQRHFPVFVRGRRGVGTSRVNTRARSWRPTARTSVSAVTCTFPAVTCSSPRNPVQVVNFAAITPRRLQRETMVNPGGSSQPPPVGTGSLSWKRCAGCGGKIADRFLLYTMDSYWHSRCLKCSCCQAQLGEIGTSCYTKSGMILCRNDYIRLFGNSGACSACGQSIPSSELVMRAQGNVYHLKCFACSTCRNRLVPGDRFHYINGSLFCEHDRPTALINGHLSSLQTNPLLPDQKVC
ncbi:unnamed protein product [Pleuronectes platessa]|uniref:LIM zinc-binding domain-containing protein n=3 Tax=Pleuronectidae TaxID=8256 RepID=A0A9N7TIH5_PLEPL|nr:unnamed protein product [Pleuronectes platessa]